jgi:hypothetical protein
VIRLPIFQTSDRILHMMQTKWASILNIFVSNPSLNSQLIENVSLINGTTVVNHKLGRKLTGWRVAGINGAATIYDKQASNQMPQLTLILVSNAAVLTNLEVF